ncbi:MAG TPA: trehalase family glycosidase, partial [Acidobacteriaceae bacterium]|nr:trehalase family glycosidase [Acidobacteriaceae bacterium]
RAILSVQYPNGFVPVNAGADDVEVNTPNDGTYDLDPRDFYRYTETADPYVGRLEYRSPQPHQWGVDQKEGIISVQEKTMLPILGMAAWQVYLTTGDQGFLAEMYRRLSRYDDWFWRRRNTGDGLLVWYNPEESGWDNAARLLPLPVKTVDGSTMAYLLRKMLAASARQLALPDEAAKYEQRAEQTARSINEQMWDDTTGFYYDLSLDGQRRREKSPAGFLPLMAGIVSEDRGKRLAEHLRDAKEFATSAPVPTVSLDDPEYDPRTWGWNGPSWIPSNWLVMESFARAGMVDDSNRIMQAMEEMMSKPDGWPGAYEQYNSQTGMPFGVADYSWSGAINDYLTRWVAGVQPDVPGHALIIAPHLLGEWKSFELDHLRIGHNEIGYRWEENGDRIRMRVNETGPDTLNTELVIHTKQPPHQVLLNGIAMAASTYRIERGDLHIAVPGSGTQTVDVIQ